MWSKLLYSAPVYITQYVIAVFFVFYIKVRRVWDVYYTCTDVGDTTETLGVFLEGVTAALDAGMSPEDLSSRLKAHLLQSAERLDYHLDGDQPMVLYRLWLR